MPPLVTSLNRMCRHTTPHWASTTCAWPTCSSRPRNSTLRSTSRSCRAWRQSRTPTCTALQSTRCSAARAALSCMPWRPGPLKRRWRARLQCGTASFGSCCSCCGAGGRSVQRRLRRTLRCARPSRGGVGCAAVQRWVHAARRGGTLQMRTVHGLHTALHRVRCGSLLVTEPLQ